MKLKSQNNKKGQAALEYLMTYGWAILVVIGVGVAMWQLGVFNPPSVPPACTGFSQVRPIGHKADSSTGTMVLVLVNDAGVKVQLDDVNGEVFGVLCTVPYSPATPPELRSGQSTQVNVTGCTFPNIGEYYKTDITIEYTNKVSGIQHKGVGECHGHVE